PNDARGWHLGGGLVPGVGLASPRRTLFRNESNLFPEWFSMLGVGDGCGLTLAKRGAGRLASAGDASMHSDPSSVFWKPHSWCKPNPKRLHPRSTRFPFGHPSRRSEMRCSTTPSVRKSLLFSALQLFAFATLGMVSLPACDDPTFTKPDPRTE